MRARLVSSVLGSLITLVMLSACAGLSGKESNLSYAEASEKIVELAEPSLRIGLGTDLHPAEKRSRQSPCDDAFGAPSEYVRPVVQYRFPLELIEGDPDRFVEEVEELWRSRDLETSPHNSASVTRSFGTTPDGFNFRVFVNRESGIAFVGGSGPCVDPPEE